MVGTVERLSVSSAGAAGNGHSFNPVVSSNGRYVAFSSDATNLVTGDTNGQRDIFVYDRQTDTIERVSIRSDGGQATGGASHIASISYDGRYVAFQSDATNLVDGDTNARTDIFVYDRTNDTIQRISTGPGGVNGTSNSVNPSISGDGRFVTYSSFSSNLVSGDTNGTGDVFIYDRDTGNTVRADRPPSTQGNSESLNPAIDADGSRTVFESGASNFFTGDTNNKSDIFVYHGTGEGAVQDNLSLMSFKSLSPLTLSTHSSPPQHSDISGDGTIVAWQSHANDYVSGDTNNNFDIFIAGFSAAGPSRISIASDGSQANFGSFMPALSYDGRFVSFYSNASNLVAGDTNGFYDIFVHDRGLHTTQRVSVTAGGAEANEGSFEHDISADGRYVVYVSSATNLVPGDSSFVQDVFIVDVQGDLVPTDIALSNSTIAENSANGTVVGALTGTDANTGETLTFSLVDNAGGRFAISGTDLVVNGALNFEAAASHTVTIRVTDSANLTYDEDFNISVGDVNEAPTDIALSNASVAENSANGTVVGALTGSDPESNALTFSFVSNPGNLFAISGGNLVVNAAFDFETTASYAITIRATDTASNVYDEEFVIQIDDVAGATIHGSGGNDTIDATNTVAGQALPTGEADIIKGNAGSDTIHGLAGDDALSGNAGDDYLDGGTGADAMFGGAGDDTYVVDNAADKTAEGATGDGEDLVVSSVGRTLGAGLENLTLSGAASVHGTGNDAANELTGNTGDNTLRGLAGSDLLDGGEGADRLYGGLGDDTYVVDNADDDVIEGASDDGDDTVMSSVGRTLDANLENLTLTGSDDINGKGNSLGNSLVGNDGANALRGEAGADVIDGGAGRDLLFGGADGDTFVFSHVADTGLGGANRDQIRDFGVGDLIDLTGMAAEAGVAFAFIGGAAFSNVAGQVRQLSAGANTLVAGDVNGDKVADFSFLLTGSHTLQSSDFML